MKITTIQARFGGTLASVCLAASLIGSASWAAADSGTADYTEKLSRLHVFQRPLVWVGDQAPEQADSKAIWDAFGGEKLKPATEALPLVDDYLKAHTNSPWGPGLRVQLGEYYREKGYFSSALENWESAWARAKMMSDDKGREVADKALLDRLQLLASLGRTDAMKNLMDEAGENPVTAPNSAQFNQLKMAYFHMLLHPEDSYRCGTLALDAVAKALYGTNNYWGIRALPSPSTGFSMASLVSLAESNHLGMVAAERPAGSQELVSPSVVHWKENHYAAIIGKKGDKYEVVDPTFKMTRWLAADAINHEASGQFLLSASNLPAGWHTLTTSEAASIFGKGYPEYGTHSPSGPPCTNCSCPAPSPTSGPGPSPRDSGPRPGSGCPSCTVNNGPTPRTYTPGMPVWEITEPDLGLWLTDEPLAYQTATGGEFGFTMRYYNAISTEDSGVGTGYGFQTYFTPLGYGWGSDWTSFIVGETWQSDAVTLFPPGGGVENYTSLDGSTPNYDSNNRMLAQTNSTGALTNFELIHPDGSMDMYAGNASNIYSYYDIFLLTQKIDAHGRTTTFVYNTNTWTLSSVIDTDGNTTTVTTNAAGLISQIQDPYGHTVTFKYNANSILTNVTDVAGLSTAFSYAYVGILTNMITPYGPTGFNITSGASLSNDVGYYYDIITEPTGAQEMFLSPVGSGFSMVPVLYTDPGNVPTNAPADNASGTNTLDNPDWFNPSANDSMSLANTFYWGPRQFANLNTNFLTNVITGAESIYLCDLLTTNDYANGRMRHWLEDSFYYIGRSLSMERQPSPDGVTSGKMVWWDYPGKDAFNDENSGGAGSSAFPNMVIEVLPDGTEAYTIYQTDQFGNRTNIISTYSEGSTVLRRTNRIVYAANGEDIVQLIGPDGVINGAFGYNANHQVLDATNAVGDVTAYSYNANGQLTGITYPTGMTTTNIYGTGNFLTTTYDYTATGTYFGTNTYTYSGGLVLTHTDARGLLVTNSWDALERPTKVSYPDGTAVNYTYDNLDLAQVVDRMGFTNSYGYNGVRQLLAETNALGNYTLYDYCLCGALNSMQDMAGNYTYYYYDNSGRLTNTVFPDGYAVTMKYDSLGRTTNVTDIGGVSTVSFFDNQNLIVAISNAIGQVKAVAYDINNRVTNAVDGNGVVTTNGYDNLGRVVLRAVVGSGTEQFGYTPAGLILYTNQLGFVTTNGYDAARRKTAETNADGQVTLYAYDPANDLTNLTDGNSHLTSWGYDLYGRLTNKVDATGTSILQYQYDADNRLTNRWSLGRTNTGYGYDRAGNLTNVTYQASHALTFAYDSMNRPTTMGDGVGTTVFTYTPAGQLASEAGPWASDAINYTYANRQRTALSLQQPEASPMSENYVYDSANRLASITSPTGVFGYSYATGTQGLVSRISLPNTAFIENAFDSLARLTNTALYNSGNVALDSTGYAYNNANQRTQQFRGVGTQNTNVFTYDNIGQLIGDVSAEGTTNRMNEQLHYAYDAAGNLNYRTNNTLVENLQVNNLNELTTGTNGGRLTVMGTTTSQATNVTVNGTNALLYGDATFASTNMPLATSYTAIARDAYGRINTNSVTVALATNVSYQYDLNGNLTNDGTMSYAYDDENQLTQVWVASQWKSVFTYDGKMRRRVRQEYVWQGSTWTLTNTVYYVYDGNLVIQERDVNYLPIITYSRGKDLSGTFEGAGGIGGLLARTDNTTGLSAFYHMDGNGNVTMLVNSAQAVAAKYLYDGFGNTLSKSGSLADANLYRFSSKETHQSSGLIYYSYRFYDPSLQRWPNQDPIGEAGGVNLYGFVGNNPVNRIDPYGLSWLVSGTPFAPGQQGTYGPYAYYLNDGRNDIIPANEYPTEDMFYGGLQSADGDFLLLSGLADGLAAVGKFGLNLAESGIKAAGKCFAKEAPQAAKPAWSKPLTQAQAKKLADAMAKSLDDKLKTGGFNAAMYEIMIENGATPAEAYAATFGRLKP